MPRGTLTTCILCVNHGAVKNKVWKIIPKFILSLTQCSTFSSTFTDVRGKKKKKKAYVWVCVCVYAHIGKWKHVVFLIPVKLPSSKFPASCVWAEYMPGHASSMTFCEVSGWQSRLGFPNPVLKRLSSCHAYFLTTTLWSLKSTNSQPLPVQFWGDHSSEFLLIWTSVLSVSTVNKSSSQSAQALTINMFYLRK